MTKFRVASLLVALGCLYFIFGYPNSNQAPHNALFFIMGAALIGAFPKVTGVWVAGMVLCAVGFFYPMVL